MKSSELIRRITEITNELGDVEVWVENRRTNHYLGEITGVWESGNSAMVIQAGASKIQKCKTNGCPNLSIFQRDELTVVASDDFVDWDLCWECNASAGKINPYAQAQATKKRDLKDHVQDL